jgi:hypothetical protein
VGKHITREERGCYEENGMEENERIRKSWIEGGDKIEAKRKWGGWKGWGGGGEEAL